MNAEQLAVKFFVEDPSRLDLGEFIPIFHAWIQHHRLDELLIDVADYRHVHQGPGVVLVSHGGLYAMDGGEGRLGLQHTRKRVASGPRESRLEKVFRSALKACVLLESEPLLKGRIRFGGGEVLFRLHDRLHAPNTTETFEAVRPELEAFLARLYAGSPITMKHQSHPAELFGLEIRASNATDVATLLDRLG